MEKQKLQVKCESDAKMMHTLENHLFFLSNMFHLFKAFNNPADKLLINELEYAIVIYHRLTSKKTLTTGIDVYDMKIALDQLNIVRKETPEQLKVSRNIISKAIEEMKEIMSQVLNPI